MAGPPCLPVISGPLLDLSPHRLSGAAGRPGASQGAQSAQPSRGWAWSWPRGASPTSRRLKRSTGSAQMQGGPPRGGTHQSRASAASERAAVSPGSKPLLFQPLPTVFCSCSQHGFWRRESVVAVPASCNPSPFLAPPAPARAQGLSAAGSADSRFESHACSPSVFAGSPLPWCTFFFQLPGCLPDSSHCMLLPPQSDLWVLPPPPSPDL